MRTNDEIKAEIEALKAVKPRLPRRNGFGEDNHAMVDIVLEVLEGRMDEDEVYDRWGEDACGEDFSARDLDEARQVLCWLEGEEDSEAPSKGWLEVAGG